MKATNLVISLGCAAVSYLMFVGIVYGMEWLGTATINPWLAVLVTIIGTILVITGIFLGFCAIMAWFIK